MNKLACIIPARGGSKRIPKKNIHPLFGKPLLEYNIDLLIELKKTHNIDIVVSSDSKEILNIASQDSEVICLERSLENATDASPKVFAVREAYNQLVEVSKEKYDAVVIIQANSPELKLADLKRALSFFKKKELWEVFSVSPSEDDCLIQDAAFRIMTISALFQNFPSAHIGCVKANYIDINNKEDLTKIQNKYSSIESLLNYKYN